MVSSWAPAPRAWVQRCANERRAFAHAVFACGACAAVFRLIPCALVQHRGSNGAARAGGRGMSGKLSELLRLRAADARAKEQQACAQQALRRAKQREGRRKPFGEKLQRKDAVAVLLYVMSGHDTACSVFWLEREAGKQRAELVDRAVLEGQVLEHYRACDGEALAAAAADDRAAPNSIVGQARAFYRDWRAAVWVEKENATKKVAVSTKALAAWVQAEGSDAMLRGGDGAAAGSALRGKVRMWAVRWRRRMGARLRRPKLEECVPAAALREKAGRFFSAGVRKKVVRRPHFAAANRVRFPAAKPGPRQSGRYRTGVEKADAKCGRGISIFRLTRRAPQAAAMWQWSNFLHARLGPARAAPLHVNLDETHVCVRSAPLRGNVVDVTQRVRPLVAPVQAATRAETRAGFTHVALICDDPAVQPVLPQVLLVSERLLSRKQHRELMQELPANVILLRTKNGWNNAQLLQRHVKVLGDLLRVHAAERPCFLCMDAARIHLAPAVLRACRRQRLRFLLIPAQMTGLLQPCDARVFSLYKRKVAEVMQESVARDPGRRVGLTDSIQAVCCAVREVMEARPWSRAFDASGLRGDQNAVASSILHALELPAIPPIPSSQPTAADLAPAFPRRCAVPYAELWLPPADGGPADAGQPPPLPPPDSPPEATVGGNERPWWGRTRSSSSGALAASAHAPAVGTSAAASSASAAPPPPAEPWPLTPTPPAPAPRLPRAVRLPQARVRPLPAEGSQARHS